MNQDFNAGYWQQRYQNEQTGWDVGSITTPMKEYFDQLTDKRQRILVPGCGNAYEAEYLFQNGFPNVYVVDLAEAPLQNLKERLPGFPDEQLLHRDFFSLGQQFDLIVEQTFFCALYPGQRLEYVQKCAALLPTGGKLAGLLFDTAFSNPGPPFGGSREEYRALFAPYFDFLHFDTAHNSIPPRQGRELFMLLQKKEGAEV